MKSKGKGIKRIAQWLLCLAVVLAAVNLPAFATEVKAAEEPNYLTFTAQEDNSSVTFRWLSGSDVKYSTDGGANWIAYTAGTEITLASTGDKVSFKGLSVTTDKSNHFSMSGKIAASGDVTSLTNGVGGDATLEEWCCYRMFYECKSLISAPALPATTMADDCYREMFYGCSNLIIAPELKVENLNAGCFIMMFRDCSKLKVENYDSSEVVGGSIWQFPSRQNPNLWNGMMTHHMAEGSVKEILPGGKYRVYSVANINFNLNDGSWVSGYTKPDQYVIGTGLMLPTATNISRAGYAFDGWYDNAECTGSPVTSIDSSARDDKTYYAKWHLHTHGSWIYSVENTSSLKATCKNPDCSTPAYSVALTLSASDANFSGSAYTGAALSGTASWIGGGLEEPTIYYEGTESTGYEKSTTAPTAVGTYKATMTAGDKTAEKTFDIVCDHSLNENAGVNNGDGTHDINCSVCGVTIVSKENHNFADGECIQCNIKSCEVTGDHNFSDETCQGVCNDCGAKNIAGTHNFLEEDGSYSTRCKACNVEAPKCGENAYYAYDETSKTLRIYGSGSLYMGAFNIEYGDLDVYNKDEQRALIAQKMKKVIIGKDVTEISFFAFGGYHEDDDIISQLETVEFEEGCKLTTINNGAFSQCESLLSFNVPNCVKFIGDSAFYGCYNLSSVTLSNSLEVIDDEAFEFCKKLTNIVIPQSVSTIGDYSFENCEELLSITIQNHAVEIGQDAFWGDNKLKNIYMPCSFDGDKEDTTAYWSDKGISDTSIVKKDIHDFTDQSYAADEDGIHHNQKCKNCDFVTQRAHNFSDKDPFHCSICGEANPAVFTADGFTMAVLPNDDTVAGMEKCYTIYISGSGKINSNFNHYLAQVYEKLIPYYSRITRFSLMDGITGIEGGFFGMLDEYYTVEIPHSVTSIEISAFWGCDGATLILHNIGVIDEHAFVDCTNMNIIFACDSSFSELIICEFSGLSTASVKTLDHNVVDDTCTVCGKKTCEITGVHVFSGATCLDTCEKCGERNTKGTHEIAADAEVVKRDGCMHGKECSACHEIIATGDHDFSDNGICSVCGYIPVRITVISDTDKTVKITGMKADADLSKGLVIPAAVKVNGEEYTVTEIAEEAFDKRTLVGRFTGDLIIPDSVIVIGNRAFFNAGFDGKLTIGNRVETIGEDAFKFCEFKGNLVIPDSVTSIGSSAFEESGFDGKLIIGSRVETIGSSAFGLCSFTGDLTIPDSVTSIGGSAFERSGFDGKLIIGSRVTTIDNRVFTECGFSGELIIPDSVTWIGEVAFQYCMNVTGISVSCSCQLSQDVRHEPNIGIASENITRRDHDLLAQVNEEIYGQFISAADCTHPAVYRKYCRICQSISDETFEVGTALGHSYKGGAAQTKCDRCDFTREATMNVENLTVTSGVGEAVLTWSAVPGAVKYAVYMKTSAGTTLLNSNVTTNSYKATGLAGGEKIGFTVRPYIDSWGSYSPVVWAMVHTPQTAVVSKVVVATDMNQATVSWSAVSGAREYALYQKNADGTTALVSNGLTGTNYTVTGLADGARVGYSVRAKLGSTWYGYSTVTWVTLPAPAVPPTGVKAQGGDGCATVTWNEVPGAGRYALYQKSAAGVVTLISAEVTGTAYEVTGLTNGETVGFVLKSRTSKGWSTWSATGWTKPQGGR